jgi:hypothetical protein
MWVKGGHLHPQTETDGGRGNPFAVNLSLKKGFGVRKNLQPHSSITAGSYFNQKNSTPAPILNDAILIAISSPEHSNKSSRKA